MPITPFCIAMTLSVAACNNAAEPVQTASGATFSEHLVAEMPNGCSLYLYDLRSRGTGGQEQVNYGQYILCDAPVGSQQLKGSRPFVDPAAQRRERIRSKALSRLSAEERSALGVE